jgi:hypothetical protein
MTRHYRSNEPLQFAVNVRSYGYSRSLQERFASAMALLRESIADEIRSYRHI